ncbi:AAA family ATPase [Sabulicella rubraurantiaca]|uniref:AAA family ATPase n=1 Tax=Sabulicella rubraurantiaca TaxID=2811429 RepID=UPI001A97C4BB|nr:AAA and adenylate/guanylate cyclase domain-containing protein [Sabulicella rubraurantiaca]
MPIAQAPGTGDGGEELLALLWLDVAGSSRIAGSLIEQGPAGVEHLAELLGQHFNTLLEAIAAHGGEPLVFVGDGLLSAWRCTEGSAQDAVLRAARCAVSILSAPTAMVMPDQPLELHAVLSLGPCRLVEMEAGTHRHRVTVGAGIADLQATSRHRALGRLLLSPQAEQALDGRAETQPVGGGGTILIGLRDPAPPLPATASVPGQRSRPTDWSAELRQVAAVFGTFPGLDCRAEDIMARLAAIGDVISGSVRRHDGILQKFWLDESGVRLLVLFGVASASHPDDAARAVRFALEARDELRRLGYRSSFGVTMGRSFCGTIGNEAFHAWTAYGGSLNLAARLAGVQQGTIQCDEATARLAKGSLEFVKLGQFQLKGFAAAVPAYTPRRLDRAEPAMPLCGREAELAVLLDALRAVGEGLGRAVLIEAESGMGKSRLLAELQSHPASQGFRTLVAQADRIEQGVPFRGWSGIAAQLLGLSARTNPSFQRDSVLEALGPEDAPQAALLNDVLHLGFAETAATTSMSPPQRVQRRHQMLLGLLRRVAAEHPLLVILEDAHWLDAESWRLVEDAARGVPGLCLVLAMQPLEDPTRLQSMAENGAVRLGLSDLSPDQQAQIALARLGAKTIAPGAVALLCNHARGHPFLCLELAQALRDEGLIDVSGGEIRVAAGVDLTHVPLPQTLHGMLTRRMDRLEPESLLTLKVASAAGLRFPVCLVAAVHPTERARHATVEGHLLRHHRAGLLLPDRNEDQDGYAFRHGMMREAAYALMLYSQRRPLHRAIAAWHETTHGADLARFYALLAHHWEAACEPGRAAHYLRLEAERVFGMGLVRRSVEIGREAAKLLGQELPADSPAIQQQIGAEMERIARLLGDRRPEDVLDLPPIEDQQAAQLIHLLLVLAPFAHQSEQLELFGLLGCICLRLTLEHGQGPLTPDVCSMFSVVSGALTGDRENAAAWSRVGLTLLGDHRGASFARCAFIHAWFHNHWIEPLRGGIDLAGAGAEAGLGDNETIFGCFNLSAALVLRAAAGEALPEILAESRRSAECNGRRVLNAHYHLALEQQFAKAMAGLTEGLLLLGDAECDAAAELDSILETNLSNQIGYYLVTQAKLHVHAGEWARALAWAERARPMLPFFLGQSAEFELAQYRGLAALAEAAFGTPQDRTALVDDGWDCTEQLRFWEARNPGIFGHKADLLDGLLHVTSGRGAEAVRLLEAAFERASAGQFHQDAGLAAEYLARLHRANGDVASTTRAARLACDAYRRWGATAKIAFMERDFGLPAAAGEPAA